MSFGKYSYGKPNVLWENDNGKLYVGNFCSIADGVTIYLGGNHNHQWVTTYPFGHIHKSIFTNCNGNGHPSTNGSVVIGNDVWICNSVTIMSGAVIGDGAVIANNAHVVKNVEPYSITGGNPAKHIKYRFTPEQIQKLLQIKWWDWEDEKIDRFTPMLCNEDIDRFIYLAMNTDV